MLKRLIVATGLVALFGSAASAVLIQVDVDIKPQSCPNPLNVKSNGVMSVAILTSVNFDATTVDPNTVELEGVEPIKASIEDVATPFDGAPVSCEEDCTEEGPDGFDDLVLKFDTQEVVANLGAPDDGDCLDLTLTGETLGGQRIEGSDNVVIKKKGR